MTNNKSKEIKAKTFWGGEMYVVLPEVVSVQIWRYGFFEGEGVCLPMLYCLKEGMTFIDVGAHFGFFTLLGSSLVGETGKVLSFEPIPSTFEVLKKNISRCSNVHAYNCAAFSEERRLEFYNYGVELSAFNSAYGIRTKGNSLTATNKIFVEAVTIDSVIEKAYCEKVDFIKIDAESSEIYVLEGLSKTIETHKPYIVIEVGDFGISGIPDSRELVMWLQDRGYTPFEISNGQFIKHKKQDSYEYMNLLFVAE
jgi:FkbM family methyltransferase